MAVDKHGIKYKDGILKKNNVKWKLDEYQLADKSESHSFIGIQVRKGTLRRQKHMF